MYKLMNNGTLIKIMTDKICSLLCPIIKLQMDGLLIWLMDNEKKNGLDFVIPINELPISGQSCQ